MDNKIHIPNCSLSEPNISSAIKKNENGLCAMHKCNNKLDPINPSYAFGLKICNSCMKPINERIKKEQQEEANRFFHEMVNVLNI